MNCLVRLVFAFIAFVRIFLTRLNRFLRWKLTTNSNAKIRIFSYESSWHSILTEDGYKLQIQHLQIPNSTSSSSTSSSSKKPPILLIHGCMMNCQAWYANACAGENCWIKALEKAGYSSIWLSNVRGNRFSRGHCKYSTDSPEYWSFKLQEVAISDVEAFLKCIATFQKNTSNSASSSPHPPDIVAFSQGTAMIFAYLSQPIQPRWPVGKVVLLAATALPGKSPTIDWISRLEQSMILNAFGNANPLLEESLIVMQNIFPSWLYALIIKQCMRKLFRWKFHNLHASPPNIWSHLYCSTSVALILSWFRIMQQSEFPWPISQLRQPEKIALFFGERDSLCDAEYIIKRIPKKCKIHTIQDYEHLDFLWSSVNESRLFPLVMEHLAAAMDEK